MKKLLKLAVVAALAYGGYTLVADGRVDLPLPGGGEDPWSLPDATAGCVDLNSADEAALEEIAHITSQRARDIRRHRLEEPFSSLEDLRVVPGLGEGRIADIREQGLACVQ